MSIDGKERGVQDALGLQKEFAVAVEFDGTCVARISKSVKAVSEEDAKERVLNIIETVTDNQLHNEIVGDGRKSEYSTRGSGFTSLKATRSTVKVTNVYELNRATLGGEGGFTSQDSASESEVG